jgi:hypothetical protein
MEIGKNVSTAPKGDEEAREIRVERRRKMERESASF